MIRFQPTMIILLFSEMKDSKITASPERAIMARMSVRL
jgi:hypothetical protein